MLRRILLVIGVLVGLFILIQLIPVWLIQTNPPVTSEPPRNSPQTRALAQRACFDCHSNETQWPWYSRVAPVSWLVTFDTIRGRNHLNFSTWQAGQPVGEGEGEGRRGRGGNEMARVIQDGSMPPWYYLPLHPDAALTDAEKQQLIQGLQASLK